MFHVTKKKKVRRGSEHLELMSWKWNYYTEINQDEDIKTNQCVSVVITY